MIIRIAENITDYYNFPLSFKKEAKVESVQITSMNTKSGNDTNFNKLKNNKRNSGFHEILQTEIKKYR